MTQRILVSNTEPARSGSQPLDWGAAWRSLHTFGVLFALISLVDIGLALSRPQWGDPAWRFGTFAVLVGGLPLLAFGLLTGLMAAIGLDRPLRTRVWAVANGLAALLLALGLAGFLSAMGAAQAAAPVEARAGVTHTVVRTVVLASLFAVAHGYATVRGLFYSSNR